MINQFPYFTSEFVQYSDASIETSYRHIEYLTSICAQHRYHFVVKMHCSVAWKQNVVQLILSRCEAEIVAVVGFRYPKLESQFKIFMINKQFDWDRTQIIWTWENAFGVLHMQQPDVNTAGRTSDNPTGSTKGVRRQKKVAVLGAGRVNGHTLELCSFLTPISKPGQQRQIFLQVSIQENNCHWYCVGHSVVITVPCWNLTS